MPSLRSLDVLASAVLLGLAVGSTPVRSFAQVQARFGHSSYEEVDAVGVPILAGHWVLSVSPTDETYARSVGRDPMRFRAPDLAIVEVGTFADSSIDEIATADARVRCDYGVRSHRSWIDPSSGIAYAETTCRAPPLGYDYASVFRLHPDGSAVAIRGLEFELEFLRTIATRMSPGSARGPETRRDRIALAICDGSLEFDLSEGDLAVGARESNRWSLALREGDVRHVAWIDATDITEQDSSELPPPEKVEGEYVLSARLDGAIVAVSLQLRGQHTSFAVATAPVLVECDGPTGRRLFRLDIGVSQRPSQNGYPSPAIIRRLLEGARWVRRPAGLRVTPWVVIPHDDPWRWNGRRARVCAVGVLLLVLLGFGAFHERERPRR